MNRIEKSEAFYRDMVERGMPERYVPDYWDPKYRPAIWSSSGEALMAVFMALILMVVVLAMGAFIVWVTWAGFNALVL